MTSPFGTPAGLAAELARLVQNSRAKQKITPIAPAVNKTIGATQRFVNEHPNNTLSSFGQVGGILGQISGAIQQQSDPMYQLYNQLLSSLQSPVQQPQAVDSQAIMSQIQNALNPLYDQRAATAQGQSDRARADVKDMYRALSNDYERLAPEQEAQAKQAQADVEQLYGQLRSNIEGNYARVSQEQADQFQRLGIEDALPSVLEKQQAPMQDALTAASENQAQQEQRYMDIGNIDQTFYREGSPNATMAGNEVSLDLLNQLTDYLNQNEADRLTGTQTAYLDQLNQANSRYDQQQAAANSEVNQKQQMLWQILQAQLQGQQQQPLTPDTFMAQLAPQDQMAVGGAFTQLQRSPEAVYGKTEDPRNPVPGTYVETTPEWYLQQADQLYQSGQIDARTRQELLQYIQLYYGLGKG